MNNAGALVQIGEAWASGFWGGVDVSTGGGDLLKGRAAEVQGQKMGALGRLRGIASVDIEDRQGESVAQDGIDFAPMLAHGYLNDDHRDVTRGEGTAAIIGHPTGVSSSTYQGRPATRLEGVLYLDLPRARSYFDLAQALAGQAALPAEQRRALGLSVQGKTLERRGKRIVRSVVQHCAVTPWPVNPHAFVEELVKSLGRAGVDAAPHLRPARWVGVGALARAIGDVYGVSQQEAEGLARDICRISRRG